MSILEIMTRSDALGLTLRVRGETLTITPMKLAPPDLREVIRSQQLELIRFLKRRPGQGWQAIPPTDLELTWDKPSPTPTDRERVISYLLRQGADRPGPLAAWLITRENEYFEHFGTTWSFILGTYAAARDAACWQTHRSEVQLWELLEGLEEVAGTMRDLAAEE
jgi:hypothetical protein